MSFRININAADVLAGLDDITAECEAAARPAAQAMAQVLYDEVKANVAKLGTKTGKLAASIYQAYSKQHSGNGVAEYHVSWNEKRRSAKRAPHGHLLEFGYLQRYVVAYNPKLGRPMPVKRPGAKGRKPGRGASQEQKNAYWLTLPTPVHVPARPFVRPAMSKAEAAQAAGERRFFEVLAEKGVTT